MALPALSLAEVDQNLVDRFDDMIFAPFPSQPFVYFNADIGGPHVFRVNLYVGLRLVNFLVRRYAVA